MQKISKRGLQSSETFGQKFQCIFHLGKFALVKILEGTLVNTIKGSAVMSMFVVAKAANGNCIYSVMYLAYLSNIGTDYFHF